MLNSKNCKKVLINFIWVYVLIHSYLFAMYTPIINLNNNIRLFTDERKFYHIITLLNYTSFQIQILKKFLMCDILNFPEKSKKCNKFKKKFKYFLALNRIFCIGLVSIKVLFFKRLILCYLIETLQLIIGIEFGLYLLSQLYLFENNTLKFEFYGFVEFLRFMYLLSFLFKIQKTNYKIPILLLIPENYLNLNFKKIIKKKFFFNQIFISYTLFIYFFWLFLIKIIYINNSHLKNIEKNIYLFKIRHFFGIVILLIKYIALFYLIFF
nr:hypothetical protein CcurKRNrm2_p078 [Cryptomonas curvata]